MRKLLVGTPKTKSTAAMLWLLAALLCLSVDARAVDIVGSWTSGLTHSEEVGSNRALIFTAHVEDDDTDMNLSSVTYGGQSMTKVIEQNVGTGQRAYVVAYILDEADIAAATNSDFVATWAQTPLRTPGYSSVFLQNVNQINLIGASDSNSTNPTATLTTGPLPTDNNDMVIVAATCGNNGAYSLDNGFTEAIELDLQASQAVAGYKSATGANETPSATHTNANQQVIIGFVVQTTVNAPDVVGMTEADANSAIATAALTLGSVTYDYNDTVAVDLVVSQSPTAGTAVPVGSAVDLIISLGQPTVPDVAGMTEADANSAITAVDNLTVGNVMYDYNDTVAAGLVLTQSPTAGTTVSVGSAVDLVVSLGQPTVPDVAGMTEADANTAITAVDNLTVGNVTYDYNDTVAAGLVLTQSPTAGTTVSVGSAVDLVVSLGQPTVPDVAGMTEADANSAI
ncbi:MAG: PASTA domain-containing protein, partial [Planctomycetota bacterium]